MKGDFSKWQFDPKNNFTGVLHQQGRVLLDSDWNAQTRITNNWQDTAGKDIIGPGVAGVPSDAQNSFKVQNATLNSEGRVALSVKAGRIWVDGILVLLPSEEVDPAPDVHRIATYLQPPIQVIPPGGFNIDNGIRDAVILEVWREAMNGFQMPKTLIEPALGGPDTTERAHTAMAFRLLRLADGDTCENIRDKLKDNFSQKGKLTVTLQPTNVRNGECPVVEGGGYTGFEHHLYRIEIAKVNSGDAMFKWSQFNGGLVGRGQFKNNVVTINANLQAIITSGLTEFYLEVVVYDPIPPATLGLGHWKVTYGAEVTLNNNNELQIGALKFSHTPGYIPASKTPDDEDNYVFFRLWNGIRPITDFPEVSEPTIPIELRDGIRLEFEPAAGANYVPGDYWTFQVRAGGIGNPEILINNQPPEGIHYYRVPLAILNWNGEGDLRFDPDGNEISDCRRIFPPLTDLPPGGCCIAVEPEEDLYNVVEKIKKNLKKSGGGCICLLPGEHHLTKPLLLEGVSEFHITGLGLASRLHISDKLESSPVILKDADNITFSSFAIINTSGQPVWMCENVSALNITNMFVYSSFINNDNPVVAIVDTLSQGWHIEDNTFLAPNSIGGTMLADSTIRGNLCLGSVIGIELTNMYELRIEKNRFFGLAGREIEHVYNSIDKELSKQDDVAKFLQELLEELVSSTKQSVNNRYIGLNATSLVNVVFVENQVVGDIGLSAELVENGKIHANQFLTTLYAADCGLTNGMRFSQNSIGKKRPQFGPQTGALYQVGLRIVADARDCKILDNFFLNVREGIIFEFDQGGKKETVRNFGNAIITEKPSTVEEKKRLSIEAKDMSDKRMDKRGFISSSFFMLRRCERTLIQGNVFDCERLGIEWSGTIDIVDFRISNNAFIGCHDVAIQIEPDGAIPLIAQRVDTNVRLIEKNRFEVYSGAVRSVIGAVRIEKNDMRIKTPENEKITSKEGIITIAKLMREDNLVHAALDDDVPKARALSYVRNKELEGNPLSLDTESFVKEIGERLPDDYKPGMGDTSADTLYTMKALAETEDLPLLVEAVKGNMRRLNNTLEGFVINLTALQNRVVHNRIYSDNQHITSGIVFHQLSGEVRENDVEVSQIGLLMAAKVGHTGENVTISGNSLKVVGVPTRGGKTLSVFSLAISSLNPGYLSIITNHFEGDVAIGVDPVSGLGLHRAAARKANNVFVKYEKTKHDDSTLKKAFDSIAHPLEYEKPVTEINLGILWEYVRPPFWLPDPHRNRPIILFTNNRIVRGWLGIAQTTAFVYRAKATLGKSLVVNVSNNIFDYGAGIIGHELIVVGNHSQAPIKYQSGPPDVRTSFEQAANIPAPQPF